MNGARSVRIGLPSLTTRTSEWGKKAARRQPILQMSAARWVNVPTAYADYAPYAG